MRGSSKTALQLATNGVTRGSVESANDEHMMQELHIRGYYNELLTDVERFQPYGMTSVPMPPSKNAQGKMEAAEVLFASHGGQRSQTIAFAVDDRRFRQKGLQPGDVCLHDHTGANLTFNAKGCMLNMGDKKLPLAFSTGDGSIYVSNTKTAIQQGKSQVKLEASKITSKIKDSTIVQDGSTTTITQGSTTFKLEAGKVTATVGGTSIVLTDGKISLGGEGASKAVMLIGNVPSTLVFATS